MPFPELEPYTEPRRIVPRSQTSSWLDDEIRRDRDQNIRATIEAAPSPDQVARETVLARKANVAPIMIEGRLDEVERAQNTDSFLKVAERYPAIGRFAATNPRAAVAAQDDHESLGLLGSAFAAARRLQIAAGGQLYAGVNAASSMIWDTLATVDEIASTINYPFAAATATVVGAFGVDYDPDKENRKRQNFFRNAAVQTDDYRQALAQETAFGNYWVDTTLQGLQSAPIMAVAAASGNPSLAATTLGVGTGAQGYQEALRSGASKGAAIRYGVTTGFAEGALEKLPLSKLGEAIARKTPWAKSFIAQLAVEIPAEQVTTFLQDLSALAYLPENANKTFGEFLRERPQAALDTALATVGGVTATTGSIRAAQRASDVVSSVAGRLGMAVQARNEKKFFDEAAKAVQGLNLRKRDPEALRELLRQQAEDAGAGNVFVPGEAVLEYQQSDAYDQRQDPFSKYDTSEGVGGDVVIPIEDVLTDMVGTPAWEAVREHARLTQGGMSSREAATFEESMTDVMDGISQTMAREAQSERATQTVREKITDRLAGMFGKSFTVPVARDIAELAVTRMETRASRLGQELRDTNDLEVRQVMPEGVAEAIKADKLDLVVNAMRQRKPAETGEGRTLLEFIKARGGINDSGGDLKSMGVSPKLLRDFDPAQGSLGGVSGAGDFGIDTTLRAAIEEGFFPELAGVENEAGPSQLDTQALIDAIAEELAGSPRFASVREDLVRAAANDLRALLEDVGLSPDEMSDAQVREAIEVMAERDAREGFEQAAFHGSPHIFDRFSLDKIGTGEGAQAYGWGLYFTNKRDIAEHYRNMLAKDDNYALSDGTVWSPDILQHLNVRVVARKNGTDLDATIRQAKAMLDGTNQTMREMIESDIAALESIKDGGGLKSATGRLYEVSIPEDGEFLLWDKPLNQQSPKVRDALKSLGFKIDSEERYPDTGGDIYQRMARGAQESAGGYLAAQRVASLDLLRNGVAGIKYRAGQLTDKTSPDAFNYVVFDPSRVSIRAYEQESRGRIIFEQNKRIIELFQSRNLSTPIHELSHMWLEELRFDAELPDAPEQLKTDWETVKAYFAANGHPVVDGIPVEAHELWARSGERYIMEGKAPSSALTRMFETFRSWLVNIYKAVDRLRAPITPEIREVFDRLLATDEEIADARERQSLSALFKDIADSGMNEAEFAAYREQVENARADAHSTLIDKTMATVRRRAMERYRAARKTTRAEEQERIDGSPLYRAIAAMRDQRISKRWVVEEMGEDALGLLPVRVPPLYADGGIDPSIVAELNGYSGATEMIEALIGAERAHRQAREGGDKRSMRERAIEAATDAEFSRRYGDPLNDGSIEREALAAVHSEQQGEVIASEIRILARRSGKTPTPYRIARDWARGKVRGGTVVNEASAGAIQRYARNAAKAGRAAEAAMLAQNVDETFRQKQFQMFNNALVAEAKAAADEVDVAVRRMDKIARAKTRKSVDQDYLEQAQALLEAVDLRKRSQVGIERQGQWETWSAQREAEGFDILTPPSFEATIGKTNWTRLSVDNLLALDEQIKQILHLGRLKQTLVDNQERREWDDIYREVEASADEIGRKPPKGSFTDPTWFDSVKARVATVDAALLKMEQVFDWLDRGNSNGAFNRVVFRPIADAQSREQDMTRDYFGRIREALEAVPAKTIRHWGDKITLDLIDPETGLPAVFERKKLVVMALNWGNAGNRQRLADGYGWSSQGIEAALMDNLTAEEWQFVQQAWDIIDTLWPEIERMERAVNGVAPEKVEAVEVVTPFGALRGGYYPAIYDTTLDYTAEEQAGRKADLFESSYTRASTRASATKARAEQVSRPILLDIGVINRHLGEVIHDVTHREAVIRANKFLTNRKVMKAVDQTLGPEIRKQFRPWLQHIANSWAQDRAGNEGLGKFMSKARANTTVVGMGWRFTTMLTQAAGYSNSIEFVGAKWISAAVAQTGARPIETFDFVMERSGEMRNRMDTLDRDIRKEIARMEGAVGAAGGKLTAVKRFAFHGIGYMDRVVSVPTWIGAYNKAIAGGMNEADAAFAGDKAVRLSQGAAAPKDLAAVATGQGRYGEAFKWMTMFYSYLSTVYSRQRSLGRDVRQAAVGDIPSLMARAWWLVVVPPLLAEILSGRGPDDDEDSAWWAFRKMLSQSVGAIPGVRDVAEPALSGITGDFAFGYRLSPVSAVGESVVKTAKDVGKIVRGDETTRATRDILETAGYFTGLVPGQIAASTQFLVDVGNGDADPDTIGEWYEGLTKGRIKEN